MLLVKQPLTLIWVGFSGCRLFLKKLHCLKLVRIMLETSNLGRKYTHIHTYVVAENIPFSTNVLLILLMSVFFCKKISIFGENSTFTQSNIMRAVLEIFSSFFSFCKIKGYYK